jgi:hypothetical protein
MHANAHSQRAAILTCLTDGPVTAGMGFTGAM